MTLTDFVERVGRTLFEGPFGGGSPQAASHAELAEIRHAILDQLERKQYRSGGRTLFPFNRVRIVIRGADSQQASALQGGFLREYFEAEIKKSLAKAEAQHPEGLRVDVEVVQDLPAKGEPWLMVSATFEETAPEAKSLPKVGVLSVIEGSLPEADVALDRERTNIGRTLDVYSTKGLSRRNHVAFVEESEINNTVSREHAHIVRDPATGEYRLFNDRYYNREKNETCSLWIIRGGASQEVHRNTRGVKLRDGDELHLGRVRMRFEIRES